jgi:hypothetical protein
MQAFGFFFQLILIFLFGSHDFLTPAFFFPLSHHVFSATGVWVIRFPAPLLKVPQVFFLRAYRSSLFFLRCMLFFPCHNCVCLVPLYMPFYTCSMQCYFILLYVDFFSFSWISFLLCLLFCTPNLCLVLLIFLFFSMLYTFLLSLLLSLIFHSQPFTIVFGFSSLIKDHDLMCCLH